MYHRVISLISGFNRLKYNPNSSQLPLIAPHRFHCNVLYRSTRYQSTLQSYHNDTIYSVSTAINQLSPTGIAVIRISGVHAINIHNLLTNYNNKDSIKNNDSTQIHQPSRKLYLHHLYHPITSQLIEYNILTVLFHSPHSYTGEHCCELHIHGNRIIIQLVLDAINSCNKLLNDSATSSSISRIRLADAGEFTRRSLINNKIDLLSVESLNQLLHIETEQQHRHTIQSIQSHSYHSIYTQWRIIVMTCLAHCEAIIDFSEDEDDVAQDEIITQIQPKVHQLYALIQSAINNHKRSELIHQGTVICICGVPNSGKSSLINILCQRNVAIVSNIPGTTRDIIECKINLNGHAVQLTDTAGLRYIHSNNHNQLQIHDEIELIGVQRARERINTADIKLLMFDIDRMLNYKPSDQVNNITHGYDNSIGTLVDQNTVIVLNKSDINNIDTTIADDIYDHLHNTIQNSSSILVSNDTTSTIVNTLYELGVKQLPFAICMISCNTQSNIDKMIDTVTKLIEHKISTDHNTDSLSDTSDIPLLIQQRHYEHLLHCIELLDMYQLYMSNHNIVLAAEQLRQCVQQLNMIIGTVHVEQLLDIIFKDFCIGK